MLQNQTLNVKNGSGSSVRTGPGRRVPLTRPQPFVEGLTCKIRTFCKGQTAMLVALFGLALSYRKQTNRKTEGLFLKAEKHKGCLKTPF